MVANSQHNTHTHSRPGHMVFACTQLPSILRISYYISLDTVGVLLKQTGLSHFKNAYSTVL